MSLVRRCGVLILLVLLVGLWPASASARPGWKKAIDRMARGHNISISVRDRGKVLYKWNAGAKRIPASNEKLLLSMALFDRVDPNMRFKTRAMATSFGGGVVFGDLWIIGRGDPSITGGGRYGRSLPFSPTRLGRLAQNLKRAGVTRITGGVRGSTRYYSHDWWAPGWRSSFPSEEVALPSALAFEGNVRRNRHISDPERRVARSLTKRLRDVGIRVDDMSGAGAPPPSLRNVAAVRSVPLHTMMRFMNRQSSNFFAETFGKRLGVEARGTPGTIARGANAIEAWAAKRGVDLEAHDGSGLSYSNRVSPAGMTRLLQQVERESWGARLRSTLPGANQGTLEDRLNAVRVRAKTGTLENISTLSGWVWLRRTDSWAEFSIMSGGMYKYTAAGIEDNIVRTLTKRAR
jgi:D-alanyl-D-alanine carboxypeptidase/D-alanyl-D-alanine-endopeptidase (penicillin-binding protein 4)